ncbi:hypothetical protein ACQKWADRAFT_323798 [Trichoderma austrokoningii]
MSSSRPTSQRVVHGPLHDCDTCGAQFLFHEELIRHMTNDGHWPTCEFCGDRFRRINQLELHLAAKHWHKCSECERTFRSQRGLMDHMRTKGHQGPIHKCRTCNAMFSFEASRDNHQQARGH